MAKEEDRGLPYLSQPPPGMERHPSLHQLQRPEPPNPNSSLKEELKTFFAQFETTPPLHLLPLSSHSPMFLSLQEHEVRRRLRAVNPRRAADPCGISGAMGGDRRIEYREWYRPLVWFWILGGLAYFAAVLNMISDWLRVLSKKTKEEVGEIKAHAAEWKANVRAEFRETRRRMSVEVHDKLQRAATIRSMERRQLGLDQRAVSLDMLSPERRAIFNSLDTNNYKTSSQESIDTKLNNLRLRGAEQCDQRSSSQTMSEDNIFNRLGSVTKLAKRNRNRDLKKNIPDETRRPHSEAYGYSTPAFDCSIPTTDEGKRKEEGEDENEDKECNTSLSDFPLFVEACKPQNGLTLEQTKENDNDKSHDTEDLHIKIDSA